MSMLTRHLSALDDLLGGVDDRLRALDDRLRALLTRRFVERARDRFWDCFESESLDALLELGLRLMSLVLVLDRDYRRNIDGFEASYVFRSRDSSILTSAVFHDGRMRVLAGSVDDPDIEVVFADAKALKQFLFARDDAERDLIGAIIDNEISYVGNVNYLSKLVYMAKHLLHQPRLAGSRAA